MLCSRAIYDRIADGSGFFQHGHTYLGHPVAAAAAKAVLDKLLRDDLPARVAGIGPQFEAKLRARFGQHAHVGDIRGRGLFWGIEFVEDRESKTAFAPERKVAAQLEAAAFQAGLICYPMAGTRDGRHGDHVLLAPPFIIEDAQMDELIDKLSQAVSQVLGKAA
jgi:adenosylmethionine-8-amino-7-oxononanoate aminotransferase